MDRTPSTSTMDPNELPEEKSWIAIQHRVTRQTVMVFGNRKGLQLELLGNQGLGVELSPQQFPQWRVLRPQEDAELGFPPEPPVGPD